MEKIGLTLVCLLASMPIWGQNYTSFFTGNMTDVQSTAQGGVCMMGGGPEHDNAMRWFLERAAGGDILVLRASGSDGYNDYLYEELGVDVNSVETIRFENANAANDTYVKERIDKAEAIWFAGGDQWDYVSYWRGTPIAAAINQAINERNIVIGGTSAGMAILGGAYFSAQYGTITSSEAIANPYANDLTVDNTPFLEVPHMANVITDTHYDDPDRRGRHVAFMARAMVDYGQAFSGIACDEATAVCIDTDGIARVYGSYPDYDDNAYFLVPNCEVDNNMPEQCVANQPLEWNQAGQALTVYAVKGTPTGLYSFDLNTWTSGLGGDWYHWSVQNAALEINETVAPDCNAVNSYDIKTGFNFKLYPNPTEGGRFVVNLPEDDVCQVLLYNQAGQLLNRWSAVYGRAQLFWHFTANAAYVVRVLSPKYGEAVLNLVVK